jgi:hypothetical protein
MRPVLLALIAAATTGCSTTPSQPDPATIERRPPERCLKEPTIHPYKLPEWWIKATPEDKAALELNAKAIDVAAIRERDALLADCRAWFNPK